MTRNTTVKDVGCNSAISHDAAHYRTMYQYGGHLGGTTFALSNSMVLVST